MSNPIVGRFSSLAAGYLRNKPVFGLYCHSEYLGKKVKDVKKFDWQKVDLNKVVGETKYPEPQLNLANKPDPTLITSSASSNMDRSVQIRIIKRIKRNITDRNLGLSPENLLLIKSKIIQEVNTVSKYRKCQVGFDGWPSDLFCDKVLYMAKGFK